MNKEIFNDRKNDLINLANIYLAKNNFTKQEENSVRKILEILGRYSFENRMEMKGLLSHTIVDSLELDYSLGEKLIKFDDDIK